MLEILLGLGGLFLTVEFWQATVRGAAPVAAAAAGEAVTERTGVINIAIEGMMLMSAFAAVWGSGVTGSAVTGLTLGVLCGGTIAALHAAVVLFFRADQILSGVALNLVALGLSTYLARLVLGESPTAVASFTTLRVPLLADLPLVGPLFFEYHGLIYVLYGATAFAGWALFRTHLGLRLRAVGENPAAVANAGFRVVRLRWLATVFGGLMAGLAGGAFALGNVRYFTENMTAGVGFVALALVIVARWNPWWLLPAGPLYGRAPALGLRAQTIDLPIPYEWLMALPYVLTLVVYFIVSGRKSAQPAVLGRALD